jgi:hypothetical protein
MTARIRGGFAKTTPQFSRTSSREGRGEGGGFSYEPVLIPNARFPLGPSECAFALNTHGSILKTTGPALRDLAGR